MKKIFTIIMFIISMTIFAGGSHFHPKKIVSCKSECTEADVRSVTAVALKNLADTKTIPTSWTQIAVEKIEKKQFAKGPEWVLSFFDKTQTPAKQRLYVFITLDGWLNGANHSGN